MKKLRYLTALVAFLSSVYLFAADKGDTGTLKLLKSIDLPGYSGDFDHFALDKASGRLFLAAEDHKTVEVFNAQTGQHLKSIKSFETPHSVLILPAGSGILVTDSSKDGSKILDAKTLAVKKTLRGLLPGADSIGYDAKANRIYIVTGGKEGDLPTATLAVVDGKSAEKVAEIPFAGEHVEAMALEKKGNRLYINVTDKNQVAVVDRTTNKVTQLWTVGVAKTNSPVALDEDTRRLFIICRDPGMVVVMNSDTGKVTGTAPAPLRSDDQAYDAGAKRLYVPGGEGWIGVYDTSDPDHIKLLEKVKSATGAKTALLSKDMNRLFVAVSPGEGKTGAKVLIYKTN